MSDAPETERLRDVLDRRYQSALDLCEQYKAERDALQAKLSGKIEMGTVCVASKSYIDSLNDELSTLRAQVAELREALNASIEIIERIAPEKNHDGSCGPWAPCDGDCMAVAHIFDHTDKANSLLIKTKP